PAHRLRARGHRRPDRRRRLRHGLLVAGLSRARPDLEAEDRPDAARARGQVVTRADRPGGDGGAGARSGSRGRRGRSRGRRGTRIREGARSRLRAGVPARRTGSGLDDSLDAGSRPVTTPRSAVLAGPQPVFRAGLAAALRRAGIDVVAEVASATAAIEAVVRLNPGVCVLDESVGGGAIVTTKRLTAVAPETLVVVLGAFADEEAMIAAVRAGASGYLPKSTSAEGLGRAVHAVLEGGAAIPRRGVSALVRELQSGPRRSGVNGFGVALTEREAAVVELLRAGHTTREIAEEL